MSGSTLKYGFMRHVSSVAEQTDKLENVIIGKIIGSKKNID
jgi:hypothetical protein